MKVILYMAMSVNGMIARKDRSEDFLSHEHWEKFCELANEFGNSVVGRKTYEAVKRWNEEYSFDDLEGIEKIIISADPSFTPDQGYHRASGPEEVFALLSEHELDSALIAGGAQTNSSFAKRGLLDEVILNIEPVLIGEGIPLFAPDMFELDMQLLSSEVSESGITTLRYSVLK